MSNRKRTMEILLEQAKLVVHERAIHEWKKTDEYKKRFRLAAKKRFREKGLSNEEEGNGAVM